MAKHGWFALKFHIAAHKEWNKLDGSIRTYFRKKLKALVTLKEQPTPATKLSGFPAGFHKLKHNSSGYRLVYHYDHSHLTIWVIAVGRRNRNIVYDMARSRS